MSGALHDRRHQEKPYDVRLFRAHFLEHLAYDIGHVQEHAAAGAAHQARHHVNARPRTAHAEFQAVIRNGQVLELHALFELRAQPASDERVIIAEGETTQGARTPRLLRAGDPIELFRIEPGIERGFAFPGLEVVAGAIQPRHDHFRLRQERVGPSPRGLAGKCLVGVDAEHTQMRYHLRAAHVLSDAGP